MFPVRSPRENLMKALAAIILLVSLGASAQQPTSAKPEDKTAVIRFFAEVNPGTTGILLQTVDTQFKSGTRKFILLMSSGGGDVLSGFMVYNYLKGLPIELTTFNVGNVDSAASVIYCAGSKRYAVPEARFIIHELSLTFTANGPGQMSIDLPSLEAQISLLKSQETSMARILATTIGKPQSEAETKIHTQTALSSEEAQKWGLVQDIRTQLFDPANATLVSAVVPNQPVIEHSSPTLPTIPQFSYSSVKH